jgi:hypothetical protein
MTSRIFPTNEQAFLSLQDSVTAVINLDTRLPVWPFRGVRGHATIFEDVTVLGRGFGVVLSSLANAHGDTDVIVVGLEPGPDHFHNWYNFFPAFRIARENLLTGYGDAMWSTVEENEVGEPTFTFMHLIDTFVIAGSSGTWAIFFQRTWEIGILLTPESSGDWLSVGEPWFGPDSDLDSIFPPPGWGGPRNEAEYDEFARNLREHGHGR